MVLKKNKQTWKGGASTIFYKCGPQNVKNQNETSKSTQGTREVRKQKRREIKLKKPHRTWRSAYSAPQAKASLSAQCPGTGEREREKEREKADSGAQTGSLSGGVDQWSLHTSPRSSLISRPGPVQEASELGL